MQRSCYLGLDFPLARRHLPALSSSLTDAAITSSVAHRDSWWQRVPTGVAPWLEGLTSQILHDNEQNRFQTRIRRYSYHGILTVLTLAKLN